MPPVIDTAGNTVDIVALSDNTPVISIRFLGAMCAHCMQQLALFQEYTEQLRAAKAVVVAFSDNDVAKCREVTKQYGFAGDVFSLCSDSGNVCSKAFGTTIEERNGTVTELHGVRILVKRSVIFEHYSATPYTDVRHILAMISRTTR
ncbi:MAG: hypothetical protein RLZZ273_692 [Bacteroidota bacterium]